MGSDKVAPPADHAGDAQWGADGSTATNDKDDVGARGGDIAIVAETLELDGSLALRANGGRGRRGRDGMNGGDGADGSWETTTTTIYPAFPGHLPPPPTRMKSGYLQRGGHGGRGGDGAPGATGGPAGTIKLHGKPSDATHLTLELTGGPPGEPGNGGGHGRNGNPGGTREVRHDLLGDHETGSSPCVLTPMTDLDHGKPGGTGDKGADGAADFKDAPDDLGQYFDAAFLLMLQQVLRARMVLSGPPADAGSADPAWQQLGEDLDWLKGVVGGIAESSTDLEQERKALIGAEIRRMAGEQKSARSIDGRSANWTPLLAFEKLADVAKAVGERYANIQADASAASRDLSGYVATAAKDSSKRQSLLVTLAGATARISDAQAAIKDLTPQLRASDDLLDSLRGKLEADNRAVQAMQGYFQCPSMNDVFKAAEMLAFSPELPMAATQVSQLLYDGFDKIEGLNGKVDKSYTFSQLNTLGKDVLADARAAISSGLKDDNGLKGLLTRIEGYKAQITNVKTALGKAGTDTLEALDSFDRAIRARADLLARYNAAVQMILGSERQQRIGQKQVDALAGAQAATSNPLRTGIVQLLLQFLQVERERLLQRYLEARQAWSFRYLADPADDPGPWMKQQLYVNLDATFTPGSITDKIATLNETAPTKEESLGPVKRVPSIQGVLSDVRVEIRDKDALDSFRKNRVLYFTIDPEESLKDATFRPLNISGKGNIHVEKVRPRLIGATGTDTVIMRATQCGISRLIFESIDRSFGHPNVDFDFTWDLGKTPDFGSGATGEFDVSGDFVGPALFGRWKLALTDDQANQSIALNGLTLIQIEFACTYNADSGA